MNPPPRPHREALLRYATPDIDILQPGDFGSFTQEATDYSSRIRVFREGNGIKVTFNLHRREGGFCTDWCSEFCCGGYAGGTDVYPELANWYFDDCS